VALPVEITPVTRASPVTNRRRRHPIVLVSGAFLVVIAVGLAVCLTVGRPSTSTVDTTKPSIAVSAGLLAEFRSKLPIVFLEAIDSSATPPSRAYAWLQSQNRVPASDEVEAVQRLVQRFELVSFYHATNGDKDWINKDGWLNHSSSECEWFGCQCGFGSAVHSVVTLNLTQNGLTGGSRRLHSSWNSSRASSRPCTWGVIVSPAVYLQN
jgi:hypothetical protein